MAHTAKTVNSLPKKPLAPLPGAVCAQWVQCGKSECRCARGSLHGPYHRRFWRVGGRLRSAYVRRRDLDAVRKAVEAWHREQREAREQWQALEEFYMYEFREMRAQLREQYGWKG